MPVSPPVRASRIVQAIHENRQAVGFHLIFPMVEMIEMMAREGFDFVYLDGEHGAFERADIEAACRAAETSGLTVLGRVPRLDDIVIRQYLDSGVQGIVVPQVSSASEARAAVAATFYAPKGQRSFSSSRSTSFHVEIEDMQRFYEATNAQITLTIQIENRRGLENADEIAAVEGVDYITIGKQDLALDLGLPRLSRGFDPRLHEAVQLIEAALARHGRRNRDHLMRMGRARDFMIDGARRYLGRTE